MIEEKKIFGFIIIDGKSTNFAIINGNRRRLIYQYEPNLPNKHSRGGQSAPRFQRKREEARENYITKMCEKAKHYFISPMTNKLITEGLIIAGNSGFKHKLSARLDKRLSSKILTVLDVQYGKTQGLNEAIRKCSGILSDDILAQQEQLHAFFDQVGKINDGLCYYGIENTIQALESGAAKSLLVWDELDIVRDDGCLWVDWFIENHENYGVEIKLISNICSEANQFIMGFGGVGGVLRWAKIFYEEDDDDSLDDEW